MGASNPLMQGPALAEPSEAGEPRAVHADSELRLLMKDPSRRYQNLFDLRNDLEDLKRDIEKGSADETTGLKTAARRSSMEKAAG